MIPLPAENLWLCEARWLGSAMRQLRSMPDAERRPIGRSKVKSNHRIATIPIQGPMEKRQSLLGCLFGGCSMLDVENEIFAALDDDSVGGILLWIDSPGGTFSGTQSLADAVALASKQKPTIAYISDLCASAAYWVASQANQIFGNRTAIVGSIGTFMVVDDSSKAAAAEGVTVHVIRAGEFKGAGIPGTEITAEQLADMSRLVNSLNLHFVADVSTARRIPRDQMRGIADGRVHVGQAAVGMNLIDGVKSFHQVFNEFANSLPQTKAEFDAYMAERTKVESSNSYDPVKKRLGI